MSAAGIWAYGLPPDDPLRRAIWVLPLAAALVLAGMLALAALLHGGALRTPAPPPPVQAEFYELPGVEGPVPEPGVRRPRPAPARAPVTHPPAPVTRLAPVSRPARVARPAPPRHAAPVRLPRPPAPIRRTPGPGAARAPAARAAPTPRAAPAAPAPRKLDLGRLGEDVQAAIASTLSESEFQRVRDPNSLVARYYLASVLRKLEQVGEMTYLGTMVGEATVMFVIGPDGSLQSLQIWNSSGDPRLDEYAQRIVRRAAPFGPFSDKLERQSMQLKLKVKMLFEGYRSVDVR